LNKDGKSQKRAKAEDSFIKLREGQGVLGKQVMEAPETI